MIRRKTLWRTCVTPPEWKGSRRSRCHIHASLVRSGETGVEGRPYVPFGQFKRSEVLKILAAIYTSCILKWKHHNAVFLVPGSSPCLKGVRPLLKEQAGTTALGTKGSISNTHHRCQYEFVFCHQFYFFTLFSVRIYLFSFTTNLSDFTLLLGATAAVLCDSSFCSLCGIMCVCIVI